MSIAGFDHVAIPTEEAERMITFYRKLGFGVPTLEAWRVQERRAFSIQFGDNKINVHAPEMWRDARFTCAARAPCRVAAISVSCGPERSASFAST